MDYRKHEAEYPADKAWQTRAWDTHVMALPTSYARLALAARTLGNLGVQNGCPDQSTAGREPSAGQGSDSGYERVSGLDIVA